MLPPWNKTASHDIARMAIGAVFFWPALFLPEGGDGPEATEYGRLKGERDALERIAIQRECGITVQPIEQKPKQEGQQVFCG